ncbi:MAG: hypothetical protein LRY39_00115 [Alphaproteobacteria bacterium]|nr:hypothetical protein [Alphaproteobacteria bacterium]
MTASTSNEGLSTAQRWEEAIHAAIVVNGTQIAEGVILNPAHTLALSDSEGFSGLIMGTYDNIVQGEDYTVEIYLFSFGNQNASPGNRSLSAGTVRHTDHSGDAKIEILEVHNL